MGLEKLFGMGPNFNKIKSFEFPFLQPNDNIRQKCAQLGAECRFSWNDCLEPTHPNLMTATTNCGDPHAPTGNEMEYGSVDAAIAENVASKGNKFNPVINDAMKETFL